jgi:hypothetical protein
VKINKGDTMLLDDFKNAKGEWVCSQTVDGVQLLTVSGAKWKGIKGRCKHGGVDQVRRPGYVGASNEFTSFQSFTDWSIGQVGYRRFWHLDKDLLYKGNKIYSEKTCVFVPMEINLFLINHKKGRGEYPVGVCFHSRDKVFTASCHNSGVGSRKTYLGNFDCPTKAFLAYKGFKESLAKGLAIEWAGKVDSRVIAALGAYTVEITD